MNALVIIDPQVDFIRGSLPVPGAEQAMAYLAAWIQTHQEDYDAVYISMDQHPLNHCSFQAQGGPWPPHCVRYSEGAAIDACILAAIAKVQAMGKAIHYIEKATTADNDSYSAFSEHIPAELLSAQRVYIAGLAGDYCVRESEADLLRAIEPTRIYRIEEGIAWIQKP